MTRFLHVLFLIIGLLMLSQCKKDDEARVRVIINDSKGYPVPAISVYMFDASLSESSVYRPSEALHSTHTDDDGVATFLLDHIFGAGTIYRQTLLHFIVFNADNQVIGKLQLLLTDGKNADGTMVLNSDYINISSP